MLVVIKKSVMAKKILMVHYFLKITIVTQHQNCSTNGFFFLFCK